MHGRLAISIQNVANVTFVANFVLSRKQSYSQALVNKFRRSIDLCAHGLLSTHADGQGVDISVNVRL